MPAIRPISVALPVAVTTNAVVPRVTWVFWNTRFVRSPSATSPSGNAPASLGIGALSPVSAASCTSSVAEETIRPSAGTTSPASSRTMSPGTSLVDSSSSIWPERRTRACGTCSFASASTLARALSSWLVPITTLNSTRPSTTSAVAICDDREAGRDHDQQHDVHRVDQLAPRHCPQARRRFGRQLVRPVLSQPPLHLRSGQPLVCVDTQPRGHVPRRQRVPGGIARLLGSSSGHLSSSTI